MIYIVTPHWVCTGGVELCHQLCSTLNMLGIDSTLCYIPYYRGDDIDCDIPLPYKKYNVKTRVEIPAETSGKDDFLVVPEGFIGLHGGFDTEHIIIWWMSVDNRRYVDADESYISKIKYHLVQSEYARQFLIEQCKIDHECIFNLSDYVNSDYLICEEKHRDNTIIFNPEKGFDVVQNLFSVANNIKWQGLLNFNTMQIQDIISRAKVYIDFGKHPGKDRIPREAVLSGAIVITGTKGAAGNNVDIPIPYEYKFSEPYDYMAIIKKIIYCMENYDVCRADFDEYRERTCNEFRAFEEDVYRFFSKLLELKTERNLTILVNNCKEAVDCGSYFDAIKYAMLYRYTAGDDNESMLYLEAYARFNIGHINESIYCCQRAIKINSNYYPVYMVLAEVYLKMGKVDRAIEYARKVLTISVAYSEEMDVTSWCRDFMERADKIMRS